ncbi:hypothetical protein ACRAQ7_11585 [Erythrobacter sp. W53]|uniref:hypothetical protein n=1 Tax=Erythrobacter sp. W53 TaxID=3425947 RepID=UPI003D76A208
MSGDDDAPFPWVTQIITFFVCFGLLMWCTYFILDQEFGMKNVIWSATVAFLIIARDSYILIRNRK